MHAAVYPLNGGWYTSLSQILLEPGQTLQYSRVPRSLHPYHFSRAVADPLSITVLHGCVPLALPDDYPLPSLLPCHDLYSRFCIRDGMVLVLRGTGIRRPGATWASLGGSVYDGDFLSSPATQYQPGTRTVESERRRDEAHGIVVEATHSTAGAIPPVPSLARGPGLQSEATAPEKHGRRHGGLLHGFTVRWQRHSTVTTWHRPAATMTTGTWPAEI